MPLDVLILGGGVAGLSAAIDLSRAGLRVEIIEGRDLVGGRVFTRFDESVQHAVDLGAEFVHGLAPEIWLPLQEHDLNVTEVEGDSWCSTNGKLEPCRFFREVELILSKMDDRSRDQSFLEFLTQRFPGNDLQEAKQRATAYVSGFNAADPAQVSVHWLVHSRDAEEQIQGDRAFHIAGGYQTFLALLTDELASREVPIHLGTRVQRISWHQGSVEISATSVTGDQTFSAPHALITFPPGVLQAAALGDGIRFDPQLPAEKVQALEKLAMGNVVRVTFFFRRRIWEDIAIDGKTLAGMSFLFSDDKLFPTWWTQMPDPVPMITGWAPAASADNLRGMSEGRIVQKAMETLAGLLCMEVSKLQSELASAYFHDWDSDPFSLGAYSYVRVGGEGCQQTLGAPVDDTLFFAGEATDISGHNGTVHGAIASGKRAAKEILEARADCALPHDRCF
jgi:monoamine oxidase